MDVSCRCRVVANQVILNEFVSGSLVNLTFPPAGGVIDRLLEGLKTIQAEPDGELIGGGNPRDAGLPVGFEFSIVF
jgi:hypothetical protein